MSVVLPLVLLLSLPAVTSQESLLVVLETSAGEVVEATALRAAIEQELGMRVLSPADEATAEGVAIMTVAIAPDRAVVAFRLGGATIRRAIALPPDRRQRLRLVTWLAGNVVRDQTADLLRERDAESPEEKASERASEVASDKASEGLAQQGSDVALPPPPTAPAAMVSPAPVFQSSPAPTVATSALPRTATVPTQWTVAALIGRGFFDPDRITCGCGYWFNDEGGQNEIEVTRNGPSFAIGGTLVTARGRAGGLTLGWHRSLRSWFAPEAGATVGLWSMKNMGVDDTTDLFIRLTAGLAVSPTSWLDVVARLSLISPMGRDKYLGYASVGLRYRLPM